MENLSFDARYVIATSLGFVSNFRTVSYKGKQGFSYDMEWDPAMRSYFSRDDARRVQKSLKASARIQDESGYVYSLKEKMEEGLMKTEELLRCYRPCHLEPVLH